MHLHPLLALLTAATTAAFAVRPDASGPITARAIQTPSFDPDKDCNKKYCANGVSWCFYWGGVTAYDASLGPIPGETRTSLGVCTEAAGRP